MVCFKEHPSQKSFKREYDITEKQGRIYVFLYPTTPDG